MSIVKLMMPLGIMLAVAALLAISASPVMAQAPVTSPFSGDVTIDGDPAPDGSEVAAYVGDEIEPSGTTTTTDGKYEIMLFGAAEDVGKAVSFKVKKAGTEVWLDATTNPENPTHANYDPQVVNLFASATASVEHVTAPAPPEEEEEVPEVPAPINWPVLGGVIAAVIVVVVLILYLVVRRRAH